MIESIEGSIGPAMDLPGLATAGSEKSKRYGAIVRSVDRLKEPTFLTAETPQYVRLFDRDYDMSVGAQDGHCDKEMLASGIPDHSMYVLREWNSVFAFKLCATGKPTPARVEKAERDRERLIAWLSREQNNCSLHLRYVVDPDAETVTLAVIGKGTACDRTKSVFVAETMYQSLLPLLLNSPLYSFEPVSAETELTMILEPFEAKCRKRIRRETKEIQVGGVKLVVAKPFLFNRNTRLDDFIAVVLNSGRRLMLDIELSPRKPDGDLSRLQEKFREAQVALDMHGGSGYAIVHSEDRNLSVRKEIPLVKKEDLERKENKDWVLQALGQIEALNGGCMMACVEMASDEWIPSIVAETFRYDFFGPSGGMLVEDSGDEGPRDATISHGPLDSNRDKKGEPTYTDLVDISQALCIFQLPIPADDGIPGIPSLSNGIIQVDRQWAKDLSDGRGFLVGRGFTKRSAFPLKLADRDLMHHLYVCGRSGSGKTTLLLRLALSIAEQNEGLCLVDPHGDLASEFVKLLPGNRSSDLVYFDPVNPLCEERLNLLEHSDGDTDQMEMICNEFLGMLLRFIPNDYMGPVYERFLRKTLMLAMMAHKPLPDIFRIWQDETFRKECVGSVDTSIGLGGEIAAFWTDEFPRSLKGDWGSGLPSWFLGKFERFSSSKTMRRVLSAPQTTIDFDGIMNNKKILVVRIPPGVLTDVNAFLLGMIVTSKIRQAMLRRAHLPEAQRKNFFLIMDEFSNLLSHGSIGYTKESDTITSFLTEARKHRVSVTIAHQFIGQLKQEMRQAIFGNVQSRVFFAVGAEDAGYIRSEIPNGPEADAYVTLKNYHALAHVLRGQEQIGPFTIQTVVP